MLSEFETQIRVRYDEADPMGYVHHANPIGSVNSRHLLAVSDATCIRNHRYSAAVVEFR